MLHTKGVQPAWSLTLMLQSPSSNCCTNTMSPCNHFDIIQEIQRAHIFTLIRLIRTSGAQCIEQFDIVRLLCTANNKISTCQRSTRLQWYNYDTLMQALCNGVSPFAFSFEACPCKLDVLVLLAFKTELIDSTLPGGKLQAYPMDQQNVSHDNFIYISIFFPTHV